MKGESPTLKCKILFQNLIVATLPFVTNKQQNNEDRKKTNSVLFSYKKIALPKALARFIVSQEVFSILIQMVLSSQNAIFAYMKFF